MENSEENEIYIEKSKRIRKRPTRFEPDVPIGSDFDTKSFKREEDDNPNKFTMKINANSFYNENQFDYNENEFGCTKCDEKFDGIFQLLAHELTSHTENWSFWCNFCQETLENKNQLQDHIKSHEKNDIVVTQISEIAKKEVEVEVVKKKTEKQAKVAKICDSCGKSFKTWALFDIHSKKGCGVFLCPNCTEVCSTYKKLKNHNREVHQKNLIKCKFCVDFFEKSDLENHLKNFHSKILAQKIFECAHCHVRYKTKKKLRNHIYVHLGNENPYLCNICGKDFTLKAALSLHIRKHNNDLRHICDLCGDKFLTLQYLKLHLFKHIGLNPFQCSLCPENFSHRSKLRKHRQIEHPETMKFHCEFCQEKFDTQLAYDRHQRFYKRECAPVCKICDKKFASLAFMRRHELSHTDNKLFGCEICSKRFTRKITLDQHQNIHTGDRPFLCPICGASFAQSSALTNHKKTIHEGTPTKQKKNPTLKQKITNCSVCQKKLVSCSLTKHILSEHVVEENGNNFCRECDYHNSDSKNMVSHFRIKHMAYYECDFCGEGFAHLHRLVNHVNRHNGQKPFKCPGCPKSFFTRCTMKQHRDKHCPVMKIPNLSARKRVKKDDVYSGGEEGEYEVFC